MRKSPIAKPTGRLDVRTLKPRVKRSFAKVPKRGARARATCHIEPPRNLWDRIVLLAFTCCLFIFFHALFGFGVVDEGWRGMAVSSVPLRANLFVSSPWKWGTEASNGDQGVRSRVFTRVMVDWHGNYQLFPSATPSSALAVSIPQDAFPDPTPVHVQVRRRAMNEGSHSVTANVETPMDIPFTFYGAPHDPFRLEFEDSVDEAGARALYPIARSPRTVAGGARRTRRFGRCLPLGEACL